jgi:hypothetical protein
LFLACHYRKLANGLPAPLGNEGQFIDQIAKVQSMRLQSSYNLRS